MKRLLLFGAAASVLAACAPAHVSEYRTGKIVNVQTGQEGRLLLGGRGMVADRNTAAVEFGENVYRGEYNVLTAGTTRQDLTFSGGVVFSNVAPPAWHVGAHTYASNLRDGSLVVKNAAGQVITCRFLVDQNNRGNGECTDGPGARYTIQF